MAQTRAARLRLREGVHGERPEVAAGLPAARGAAADHVAARQRQRQRGGLDGRRLEVVLLGDGALQRGGEGQLREGQRWGRRFGGRGAVGEEVVHLDAMLLRPGGERRRGGFGRGGGSSVGGRSVG